MADEKPAVKIGDSYRVKEGCKAFLDGALRDAGYVYTYKAAFLKEPSWGEKVTETPAARRERVKGESAAKAAAKKAVAADKEQIATVTFADAGPTEL